MNDNHKFSEIKKGGGDEISPEQKQNSENIIKEWSSEKKNIWTSGWGEKFFKEFGYPEEISWDPENENIVLKYPFGSKQFPSWELKDFYEHKLTGDLRISKYWLAVKFIFPKIPGASYFKDVAQLGSEEKLPFLTEEFLNLPEEIKEKVLDVVKKRMTTPEEMAKERVSKWWNSKNDELKLVKKSIEDISFLESTNEELSLAGEYYDKRIVHGGDGYSKGRESNISTKKWYLMVGGKKREWPNYQSDDCLKNWIGGKEFYINESSGIPKPEPPKGSLEEIKASLIKKMKDTIKEYVKKGTEIKPPDIRLISISQEEWIKQFEKERIKQLQILCNLD